VIASLSDMLLMMIMNEHEDFDTLAFTVTCVSPIRGPENPFNTVGEAALDAIRFGIDQNGTAVESGADVFRSGNRFTFNDVQTNNSAEEVDIMVRQGALGIVHFHPRGGDDFANRNLSPADVRSFRSIVSSGNAPEIDAFLLDPRGAFRRFDGPDFQIGVTVRPPACVDVR